MEHRRWSATAQVLILFLYVNGDSFSASKPDDKVYFDHVCNELNCTGLNSAKPGSCNSRIFRTSLRDLIDLKKQHKDIFAVICLSFTVRTEIWDSNLVGVSDENNNDGEFRSIQPAITKTWFEETFKEKEQYADYKKQWLTWFNIEAETTNLLKETIFFTNWCKQNNINYVILSACIQEPIDFNSAFVKNFYQEVTQDTHILNFFDFSFTKWCVDQGHTPLYNNTHVIHGKTYEIGHHGTEAHHDFAKFLINNFIQPIGKHNA